MAEKEGRAIPPQKHRKNKQKLSKSAFPELWKTVRGLKQPSRCWRRSQLKHDGNALWYFNRTLPHPLSWCDGHIKVGSSCSCGIYLVLRETEWTDLLKNFVCLFWPVCRVPEGLMHCACLCFTYPGTLTIQKQLNWRCFSEILKNYWTLLPPKAKDD